MSHTVKDIKRLRRRPAGFHDLSRRRQELILKAIARKVAGTKLRMERRKQPKLQVGDHLGNHQDIRFDGYEDGTLFEQDGWRWREFADGRAQLCEDDAPTPDRKTHVVTSRIGICLSRDGCLEGSNRLPTDRLLDLTMVGPPPLAMDARDLSGDPILMGPVTAHSFSPNGRPCAFGHPDQQRC